MAENITPETRLERISRQLLESANQLQGLVDVIRKQMISDRERIQELEDNAQQREDDDNQEHYNGH